MIPALSTIVATYACIRLLFLPLSLPQDKEKWWVRMLAAFIALIGIVVIVVQLAAIYQAGSSGLPSFGAGL